MSDLDLSRLVKPLVWKECGSEWLRAVSILGQYNVMWGIEPGIVHLDHAQKLTQHDTIAAAQAAANADYAARVMAAIDTDALKIAEARLQVAEQLLKALQNSTVAMQEAKSVTVSKRELSVLHAAIDENRAALSAWRAAQ